jgi:hypothetical protein
VNPSPPENPEGTVTHDLVCVRCGYALLGLPRSGVCPECGVPVTSSIERRLGQLLGPRGSRKVRGGTDWLESAAAAQAIGFCLPFIVHLSLITWAYGSWRLSAHTDDDTDDEALRHLARPIRPLSALLVFTTAGGGTCITLLVWARPNWLNSSTETLQAVLILIAAIPAVAFGLSVWATFRYLVALAHGLPDRSLAARFGRCRFIGWLWAAGLGAFLLVPTAALLGLQVDALLGPGAIVAIGGWIAAVYCLNALTRCRLALAESL